MTEPTPAPDQATIDRLVTYIETLETTSRDLIRQGNAIQHRLARLTDRVLALEQDGIPKLNRKITRVTNEVLAMKQDDIDDPTKTGPAI